MIGRALTRWYRMAAVALLGAVYACSLSCGPADATPIVIYSGSVHVKADPTTGVGFPAALGVIAVLDGSSTVWVKTTTASTGWTRIDSGAVSFASLGFAAFFGDGYDGALNFDGTTTVTLADGSTLVPSSNVYTLTENIHATNITLAGTAQIKMSQFAVFANGTGTINGTMRCSGNSAAGSSAGTAGTTNYLQGGQAGGVGGTAGGAGGNTAGSSGAPLDCTTGVVAGGTSGAAGTTGGVCQGGSGGASVTGGGGGGQTGNVARATANMGSLHDGFMGYFRAGTPVSASVLSQTQFTMPTGGAGGGSQGTGVGGGGGASGGTGLVAIKTLSGSGFIICDGGNGAAGTGAGGGNTGGGGGGGAGGYLFLYYSTGTLPSGGVHANGGTHGNASPGGGGNGGDGGPGVTVIQKLAS